MAAVPTMAARRCLPRGPAAYRTAYLWRLTGVSLLWPKNQSALIAQSCKLAQVQAFKVHQSTLPSFTPVPPSPRMLLVAFLTRRSCKGKREDDLSRSCWRGNGAATGGGNGVPASGGLGALMPSAEGRFLSRSLARADSR